jgi:hypothetical protein
MNMLRPTHAAFALVFTARALSACSPPVMATDAGDAAMDTAVDVTIPPLRAAGTRAQAPGTCDAANNLHCLIPWPSDRYVVADPAATPAIHIALPDPPPGRGDDPASLEREHGFSRLTPVIHGFPTALDDTTAIPDGTDGPIVLVVAEPGPSLGHRVPLRFEVVYNHVLTAPQSLLIAHPAVPLAPATEYAAFVTDSLHVIDGNPAVSASRDTTVSLGLAAPRTDTEAAAFAYYAPERAALEAAHVDTSHVVRLWSFTTRSLDEPLAPLRTMRAAMVAAVDANQTQVAIRTVTIPAAGTTALVVEGAITGLPSFVDASGHLQYDASGNVVPNGTHEAVFRVAVPSGSANYPIVMFGHGTGGSYHDDTFDDSINAAGEAKIGVQFVGWTDADVTQTFASFAQVLTASDASTAKLLQSQADAMAVQHALAGSLGDALAAPMIGGMANPTAGRRPDSNRPVWAGGSLGGTMGFVYTCAEPSIVASVLNVPGAAWTHFMPHSNLFAAVRALVRTSYPTEVDLRLAIAMSQGNWDPVDGGAWVETLGSRAPVMLVQESMGDPVLPNIGSEFVAASSHAVQLGAVLAPVEGVMRVDGPVSQTAFTQFRVPSSVTAPLSIHGFGAGDSIAGRAARQQLTDFIASVQTGSIRIAVPDLCASNMPAGSCDFSSSP